jgi:phage shock protein E
MGYAKVAFVAFALAGGAVYVAGGVPAMAQEQRAAFETISPEVLAQKLEHKDFLFINVHVPYEGEIAQTDAFIPFDQIAANLDKLPSDKSASIVLYCRSGRMSEIAATTLAALGYSHVAHLEGGFSAWAQSRRVLLQHASP